MKQINAYLSFNGNCREAVNFYAKALGGEVKIMTWAKAPGAPKESADRIMHACLTKDEGTLMASDMPPGKSVHAGDNFSVCIDFDSTEEQAKCFAAMSEGGEVTMPLQETF